MKRKGLLAVFFLVLIVMGTVWYGRDRDSQHRNILLITVDTLRADHMGLYGYSRNTTPRLDLWFQDSAIFRRAYSTTSSTHASVISLLSGQHPQDHGVRIFFQQLSSGVKIVTDYLPDNYQTAAFISNMVLTDEAIGLANRFEHFDDFVDERESTRFVFERSARRTSNAVIRWLQYDRDVDRPLFLWVHYIDPHGPYRPPPEHWSRSFHHDTPVPIPIERIPSYLQMGNATDGMDYVDAYDEEIRYTDEEIDRLLKEYSRTVDLDESLVIFTSDHGESLMDHENWFVHGYHIYEELTHVPLMIRGPGIPSGDYDGLVTGIDLAPTILDFATSEIPSGLPGVNLRHAKEIPSDRVVFVEGGVEYTKYHFRGAIQRQEKWVVAFKVGGDRSFLAPHRYNLADDPTEQIRLKWPKAQGPSMQQLIALCQRDPNPGGQPTHMVQGNPLTGPKVDPRATTEDLRRLKSMGYVK